MKRQSYISHLVVLQSFLCIAEIIASGDNLEPKPSVTITGENVVVNDDDFDSNWEWDKLDPGPTKENKGLWGGKDAKEVHKEPILVEFTVSATPVGDKPGELTVEKKGGSVKLWTDYLKTTPYILPIKSSNSSTTFWVEGLDPTNTLQDAGFDATYTVGEDTGYASIRYGITRADMDVDSDNNQKPLYEGVVAVDDPDSLRDDQTEFNKYPFVLGKILLENLGDVDNDGVMDCLDGLGLVISGATSNVENLKLVPMKVKLEAPYTPDRAMVKFVYPESIPRLENSPKGAGDISATIPYKITKRGIRLWTVNGDVRSSGNNIGEGGQFIPPNKDIKWTDLQKTGRETTIYLEYVDVPGVSKPYSKEDIVYTIKEEIPSDDTNKKYKGYIQNGIDESKRTYLTEKESPDGVCVGLGQPREIDLAIASYGDLPDLPEDRLDVSDPPYHEMNPGGLVFAPVAGDSSPGSRTRLTLTVPDAKDNQYASS